ncbi:energy transducer TonB [Wenyingzhuangia sp. IMCC45574]
MFKTVHERKSVVVTVLFTAVVLFLLFFSGLRYVDPPEEYGVAINFGTSDVGAGEPKLNESVKSAPKETTKEVEQPKEVVKTPQPPVQEKVLTQSTEEAPVVQEKKTPEVKKVMDPVKKKEKPQPKPKEAPKPEKPKPTKQTQSVLDNLFGNPSSGETTNGEGDDDKQGLKGSEKGDPNSNKYYGNDGLGGDGNYLLKGRRALTKPKEKPNCNEEGTVVVRIEVDKNGKVIRAVPGVKGTTNNNPCLLEPAKKAALATKWNPDGDAPNRQVGLIRYKFVLLE